MRTTKLALAIAACLATPAGSQEFPAYERTGTITMMFGGKEEVQYTTSNTLPGQPEREVHTASWVVLEPRLLGGMNISPDDVFVVVASRSGMEPSPGEASLRVEFSLHPATLELKTMPVPSIRFHPDDGPGFYAMTQGEFEIESVIRHDAESFALIANAQGVMTAQTGDPVAHNAQDAVEFSARFDLQRVVNRGSVSLP